MGAPLALRGANWASPVSGSWTDPGNWTGGNVPDTDLEPATINVTGSAYAVTLSTPLTIAELTLNSTNATLTLNEALQVSTSTAAGKLTFASGTMSGTANIYGGPLELGAAGPSGPSGGTFNLISNGATSINKISGAGGNVLAGMTVNLQPLQASSNLSVSLHSAFANHGTLTITPSLDNPTVPVNATSFTNHGQLTSFANTNGNGAIGFMGALTNEATGVANFGTSVFFAMGDVINRGAFSIAAGNYYGQATNKFTQVSGSLDAGENSLSARIFDYQGGTITGQIDTNDLRIASGVGAATVRLILGSTGDHAIIGQSNGTGGNIPTGVNVSVNGDDGVAGVRVGAAFENDGSLLFAQAVGQDIYLSTNGANGNGTFTNRSAYTVTAANVSNDHEIRGAFVNDAAGVATFSSNISATGNVTNHGEIAMSGSRTFEVASAFTQSATGTLGIELASGGASDQLVIVGNATLDGTLEISLADGFDPLAAPPAEQSFEILSAASVDGEFETILNTYVLDGYFWEPIYTATDLTLSLTQAGPGDANIDGIVDIDDLIALATSYGQPGGTLDWINGDFDHDGDVDLNDLANLAAHYTGGQAQAFTDFQSLSTIPEPSAFTLALLALAPLSHRKRCRR